MLGVRQFNKMIKELGMTLDDENNSIDYEWIAIKLWLQDSSERKREIIDKYLKKYVERQKGDKNGRTQQGVN